jgi:lipoate-protein ligase A
MVEKVEVVEKEESVKIKTSTKKSLMRVVGLLQEKTGKRVTVDDAVAYLIRRFEAGEKKPELLFELFGVLKGSKLSQKLMAERTLDEERAKRKYGA